MSIAAIGVQSYSLQSIMSEYAKNAAATADVATSSAVATTAGDGDTAVISDEARSAAESATQQKAVNAREYALLKVRGLSDDEIAAFGDIQERASTVDNAKEFLQSLSTDERALVKKADSYGIEMSDAHIATMSEEGARNMLVTQDMRSFVDYNDDGVVEEGVARTFAFPPPNAPQDVKDAWYATVDTLPEDERLLASSVFLVQSLQANVKFDGNGHAVGVYEPGEEGYTNIFSQTRDGWMNLLDKTDAYLDWVDSVDPNNPNTAKDRALIDTFRKNLA